MQTQFALIKRDRGESRVLEELSKQQRRVLFLLAMAIFLGAGNLWYRSFKRAPVEIHLVSPITVPWPEFETASEVPRTATFENKDQPINKDETAPKVKPEPSISLSNKQEQLVVETKELPKKQLPVLIDPNTANSEELQRIPGIGPVLASRIIEYREQQKKFERLEDLLEVKGIGEKTLQKMKEYIQIK